MKCQSPFSGKDKKTISEYLKNFPSILRVKQSDILKYRY